MSYVFRSMWFSCAFKAVGVNFPLWSFYCHVSTFLCWWLCVPPLITAGFRHSNALHSYQIVYLFLFSGWHAKLGFLHKRILCICMMEFWFLSNLALFMKQVHCEFVIQVRPCLVHEKKIFACHIRCLIGCRKGFLDTNEKTNFITRLETARRIFWA